MFKSLARKFLQHWRIFFLFALGGGIFIQIVALLPRSLEEDIPAGEIEKSALASDGVLKPRRAGFEEIPEYSIKGFQYLSVKSGVKQWKVIADEAFFFNKKGFVTMREVHAEIYDEKGRITLVDSREGEYATTDANLDLFDDVVSEFPDGFVVKSDVMHYEDKTKEVTIPENEKVVGYSLPSFGKDRLKFTSYGARYYGKEGVLKLLNNTYTTIESQNNAGEYEATHITADHAMINRTQNYGDFVMLEKNRKGAAPLLIQIDQPMMKTTAQSGKFYFSSAERNLNQMIASDDVTIIEYPKKPDGKDVKARREETEAPRVATGGRAEFDSVKNTITLLKYPQVVQDHDTITGEVITIYRNTDLVEVESSNAYSERKQKP